ncbi:MAG: class I SAM-dependent methyltransferase [Methylophilaceae bacterium]|nr:class I SAM-dependent methyltransferase [Methylophilaceae bacterium]
MDDISWVENGVTHQVRWQSEASVPAPQRVLIADDTLNADTAYRLACEGTAILWRGDFQNARQLLQAMVRRCDHKKSSKKHKQDQENLNPKDTFNLHRVAQAQRARILGMLLIEVSANYSINLKRAPDISQACTEVYGAFTKPFVASLRELQSLVGAHEWRKKGVPIPGLDVNIHPHYGVFSPIRGEYLELIEKAPLPSKELAFDIGTGTGVIAAILAKRGITKVVATDQDPRAIECAKENLNRLGLQEHVNLQQTDMFPDGKAPLIVCNPPWLPAKPSSSIEFAIYDPNSQMLKAFLDGLKAHLTPNGEGWLIMSDFAERLGLRAQDALKNMIDQAGLRVEEKIDIRPKHNKIMDEADRLHQARKAEVTSLWRLKAKQ